MNRQKTHGVVYTPRWIADLILDAVGFSGKENGRVADPACGDGAFLVPVAERIIRANNARADKRNLRARLENAVWGFDIDAAALRACGEKLNALAQSRGVSGVNWNLQQADCMNRKLAAKHFGGFRFVVGNPPYVRVQHLGAQRREVAQQSWRLCGAGSTDLYIAFFELGYAMLQDGGRLGYITPNTWLKTQAGRALREFISAEKALKALADFGHHQVFGEVTTYALVSVLEKGANRRAFSLQRGDGRGKLEDLGEVALDNLHPDNWILAPNRDLERLREMRKGGTPLSAVARIHVGLTTLADSCYIFRAPEFDGEVALLRHPETGKATPVERGLLRPIVKASVLKSADEEQNRFILFPYEKRDGRHRLIGEDELAARFPLARKYFLSVKPALDARDKGRPTAGAWHAFGRTQGLDTSFGEKILTSPMNLRPNFIVWERPDHTFYSGYCVKFGGDLRGLAARLNSDEMAFYINLVSRCYRQNWRSFAKAFLKDFPVPPPLAAQAGGEKLFRAA